MHVRTKSHCILKKLNIIMIMIGFQRGPEIVMQLEERGLIKSSTVWAVPPIVAIHVKVYNLYLEARHVLDPQKYVTHADHVSGVIKK